MLGFPIIDVAIGTVFLFLVLSLVITACNELIASLLARRQATLRLGIDNLIGKALADQLYEHALIKALRNNGKQPSYIPARTFTLALLDLVAQNNAPATAPQGPPAAGGIDARITTLLTQLNATNPPSQTTALSKDLVRTLQLLAAEADHDFERFKTELQDWFDDGMERVTGWYKRRTQYILFALALVLTIGANADAIKIVGTLWRDPTIRAATLAQAEAYWDRQTTSATQAAQDPPLPATGMPLADALPPPPLPPMEQVTAASDDTAPLKEAMERLENLPLPLGWDFPCAPDTPCVSTQREVWPGWSGSDWLRSVQSHALGWLMTAFAISLGAPFWFDQLNRIMSIRSAGKAPEERPKEPKVIPQPH
jgi:hypothetical protein